jgi:hypothetical protein
MTRYLVCALLLGGVVARTAAAQFPSLGGSLGVSHGWSPAATATTHTSLFPSVTFDRDRWRAEAMMIGDLTATGADRVTVGGSAAWLGPRLGPVRLELNGEYTTPTPGDPGVSARAAGRFHLGGPTRGLWLGMGHGQIGTAGTTLVTAGGWWATAAGTISIRLEDAFGVDRRTGTWIADTLFIGSGAEPSRASTATARFLHASGNAELSVMASRLNAPGARDRTGVGVGGAWWFAPSVGLIAGYGTPAGTLVSGQKPLARFGLLLRPRHTAPRPLSLAERPIADVRALGGGTWRIRLPAPGATLVEIQGDPTGWEPVALKRQRGGWWEGTLVLAPGRHALIWRQDAGAWETLPGLPTAGDGMLGPVTVLVVDADD